MDSNPKTGIFVEKQVKTGTNKQIQSEYESGSGAVLAKKATAG